MQTKELPFQHRDRGRASAWQVLAAGAAAGALSVAVNLGIRALVVALLDRGEEVPFPLAPGADTVFTFVPTLLGTLLFLALRRTTTQPVRWFTVSAAAVVVLSWIGPLALLLNGVIGTGVMLALLLMHTVPGVVLLTALRLVDNRPGTPAR